MYVRRPSAMKRRGGVSWLEGVARALGGSVQVGVVKDGNGKEKGKWRSLVVRIARLVMRVVWMGKVEDWHVMVR